MNVRKERMHQCGLSNVDFKRLNDKPSMKKFSDDMRTTNFAYFGRNGVPYSYESCGFGKPETLQVHSGFKIPEPLDPRAETAKNYYAKLKKPFKHPASVQRKRVKQLEEGAWNEKVFTGEDVTRLNWYKNTVLGPSDEMPRITGGRSPKGGRPGKVLSIIYSVIIDRSKCS